jgi:AcrR family transcriptional regulator
MPRIAAPTVVEHVARQRARILDAAFTLFQTRGYFAVDIGMVAKSVGLKRSSFYRYYSNKDELLVACVEQAMRPVFERNRVIAQGLRPARDRVTAWVEAQFEFATGPNHAAWSLIKDLRLAVPELRTKVLRLHMGLYKTLSSAVSECLADAGSRVTITSTLISGMVQSSAVLALENGGAEEIKSALNNAVLAVLGAAIPEEMAPKISA